MTMRANETRRQNIEQLNGFLRGEISAVETYRMALEELDRQSPTRPELEICRLSHAQRVFQLKQKIEALGGTPDETSGAWGVFAKAIESSATVFGDRVAVSALEQGEDHGLADYRETDKLTPENRLLVATQLLPAQLETHRTINNLKKRLRNN
jgi:Domain of unknown function (DUF2383)